MKSCVCYDTIKTYVHFNYLVPTYNVTLIYIRTLTSCFSYQMGYFKSYDAPNKLNRYLDFIGSVYFG